MDKPDALSGIENESYTEQRKEGAKLLARIPQMVKQTACRLERNGYQAFFAGGAVRDLLMERVPADYDLATDARPDEVRQVFGEKNVLATGEKYGSVTVLLRAPGRRAKKLPSSPPEMKNGGFDPDKAVPGVEVTTFRSDGAYPDGRRPSCVEFKKNIAEDLARRDFTINATALDLNGNLIDPYGGRADIAAGLIRTVGCSEKRFQEDGLRILRALRFSASLGFSVEERTERAIFSCAGMLEKISADVKREELFKLLCGRDAAKTLRRYSAILFLLMPELSPLEGFDQRNPHHDADIFTHSLRVLSAVPAKVSLRLAALLHDVGKPACFTVDDQGTGHFYGHEQRGAQIARRVLRRLRTPNALTEEVARLVAEHGLQIADTDRSVRHALNRLGQDLFFSLLALKRGDICGLAAAYRVRLKDIDALEVRAGKLIAQGSCFTLRDLAVNGNDLLACGIPQGKTIGYLLRMLLQKVIDGDLPNERTALLSCIKQKRIRFGAQARRLMLK